MRKNFNEEFSNVYENPQYLTRFDIEEKAHVELDPVYGDALAQAKRARERMKDDFKEQDEEVKKFLKKQELEEKPKLPDTDNKKELKAMKLAENKSSLREGYTKSYLDSEGCFTGEIDGEITTKELYDIYTADRDSDPVVGQYDSFDDWMADSIDNGYLKPVGDPVYFKIIESKQENKSTSLNEDYANFIGRPLKDFLKTLDGKEKINIDFSENTRAGFSGLDGRVNQVTWDVADRLIKDIQLGDGSHYKFKILTEDKKKDLNEARRATLISYDDDEDSHRYKVVAADENAEELFLKTVKGIKKVNKLIDELTDEKLNEMGATQLYVTRDDDKEIYLKFGNDDGTWDVIQDEREMEKPAEERDSLFNHIVADLSSESTPDQKALRQMSRKGEGYVGFEDDEIGFNEDDQAFHLKSQSDKPIEWAKKVAEFYGFKTSEVSIGNNNYKYISIYTPGISSDPKLNP